jgi:O-antigen/teichoic acid export membrane protein
MARGRALLSNMAAVAAGKAVAAVAGLATITILSRYLGPHDFGYYRTVLTYSAFAAVFADLGIYFVALREMSRPGADMSQVVGSAFALRLVSTTVILLLASAVALLLPYEPEVKKGIFIASFIYVGFQANEFLNGVFQKTLKQGNNALAEASGACATLAAVWILSRLNSGVIAMLFGTLTGAMVAMVLSWSAARRLIGFRLTFNGSLWKLYMSQALPIAGSQILTMAMLRGDTLLLSFMKPATEVGLYGVPTKMYELATTLPYMFCGMMMPALTAAGAANGGRPEDYTRVLTNAFNAMLMYGVAVILALSVFAPDILLLLSGKDFEAGAPALAILGLATALTALSFVLRFALLAIDEARRVLVADACACTVALIAYFILIPRYSFVGAALGTVIAEASILICMLFALRHAGRPLPRLFAATRVVLAGVLAFGAMVGLEYLHLYWMIALVVGGGLYVGLLVLLRAIPKSFIADLRRKPAAAS